MFMGMRMKDWRRAASKEVQSPRKRFDPHVIPSGFDSSDIPLVRETFNANQRGAYASPSDGKYRGTHDELDVIPDGRRRPSGIGAGDAPRSHASRAIRAITAGRPF